MPQLNDFGISASQVMSDFDGDGYPDLFVYVSLSDRAVLHHGGAGGFGVPEVVEAFYAGPFSVADVTGDGRSDIMGSTPIARLLVGGQTLQAAHDASTAWDLQPSFNGIPALVPDLDGDGYADAVVHHVGALYLVSGTPTGLDRDLGNAQLLDAVEVVAYGGTVNANVTDVEGDGFLDLVLNLPYARDDVFAEGVIALYSGGGGGLETTPSWWATGNGSYERLRVHSIADVDGDGNGALLVQAEFTGARSYPFHPTGLPESFPMDDVVFEPHPDRIFAYDVLGADLDGDGFSDVAAGAYWFYDPVDDPSLALPTGRVTVFQGGVAGIAAPAAVVTGDGGFGRRLQMLGDADADGLPDLLIGRVEKYGAWTSSYYSYYYYGYEIAVERAGVSVLFGGPLAAPALQVLVREGTDFGIMATAAGDTNGDGLPDVVMEVDDGDVGLFLGQVGGTLLAPDQRLYSGFLRAHQSQLAGVGDVDGDGYDDVVFGSGNDATMLDGVLLFRGTPAGLDPIPQEISAPVSNADFGIRVFLAGDTNLDGYDDVWIGTLSDSAYLYLGASAGLSTTPAWRVPTVVEDEVGYEVRSAGDIDGDGYVDAVVRPQNLLGFRTEREDVAFYRGLETPRVFLGSATGMQEPAVWSAPFFWGAGNVATGVGDVDADGFGDLALGGNNRLWVLEGWEVLGVADPQPQVGTDVGDTGVGDTGITNPTDTDTDTSAEPPTGRAPLDNAPAVGCGCASSTGSMGWIWAVGVLGGVARRVARPNP